MVEKEHGSLSAGQAIESGDRRIDVGMAALDAAVVSPRECVRTVCLRRSRRENDVGVSAFGGVPLDTEQYRDLGKLPRRRHHLVLLEKDWLLPVVRQGDKVESL